MRTCTTCGIEKKINMFAENRHECRACRSKKNKERLQTEDGVIRRIYGSQKTHSRSRGHNPPSYSIYELTEWLYTKTDYKKLYTEYKKSGYKKQIKPSIDRLNDTKGYSLDNIQLLTWQENKNKGHRDSMTNKLSTGLKKKPVEQYDKEMRLLGTFISVSAASRATSIHSGDIIACCKYVKDNSKKRVLSAGGFVWRYAQ